MASSASLTVTHLAKNSEDEDSDDANLFLPSSLEYTRSMTRASHLEKLNDTPSSGNVTAAEPDTGILSEVPQETSPLATPEQLLLAFRRHTDDIAEPIQSSSLPTISEQRRRERLRDMVSLMPSLTTI